MTTTYCDPTTNIDQGADCEKPDSRILDLRKGRNPQFLAYVTNRARFQRVEKLNEQVRICNDGLAECTLRQNDQISQMLSRQPNYEQDAGGQWVPKDPVKNTYRHPYTYPASTHQGQYVGDEQNHELYRKAQRDDRQCTQFDTRCGMLTQTGDAKAEGALLTTLYSGSAWIKPGAKPSWANDNINERQMRGDRGDDNETLGYEDRF